MSDPRGTASFSTDPDDYVPLTKANALAIWNEIQSRRAAVDPFIATIPSLGSYLDVLELASVVGAKATQIANPASSDGDADSDQIT